MIKGILTISLLLGLVSQIWSQEILISYEANDKPLSQIFRDLEKDHEIYFAFSPGQLKGKKSTIKVENQEINEFLRQLLRPHKLIFELIEEKFISVKTPESVYLRAQVFDGESGETLPFATARLKDSYLGGVADQDGRFKLFIDEPLDATLQFSFLGYDTQELELNSYESGAELKITLQPEAQTLQRVVIKEYVNSGIASDEKASSFRILPQDMEILPGLSERDVLLSAQMISGINSNDETASGLNVRGSSKDNTFIYWNNIPMYQSAHYFGNISSFIPSSIGEVNIYKNYVPVKFGGASSGLLTMDSRQEIDGEKDLEVSLNMTHVDVYAKLPFKKDYGSFMIAVRRSYNELLATPTFNAISDKLFEGTFTQEIQTDLNDNFRYNSNLNFSDVNFQWLYEPSNSNTWKVSLLRSGSVLNYDSEFDIGFGEESVVQEHDVANIGVNVTWNHRLAENLGSELSLSVSDYRLNYSLTDQFLDGGVLIDVTDSIENFIFNTEFRSTFNWKINEPMFLNFGYQLNYMDVDNQIVDNSFLEEDDDESFVAAGFINAVFGELNWDINEKLEMIGALRLNHYGPTSQLVVDSQLRLNYELSDQLVLKTAAGRYNQYLTAVQEGDFSFSNTVEQHWILADDDDAIPIIRANQFSAGFLLKNDDWLLDFDLYHKKVNGILALNMGFGDTESGGLDPGEELINGIDITLMKRWNKVRTWASYNFQDSEVSFDTDELGTEPFASSLNVRHQLQFTTSYTRGPLELSLGYTFKTGLPWTQVLGTELVVPETDDEEEDEDEEEAQDPYYRLVRGAINGDRLNNYHRVDASLWYKFGSKKGRKWTGEIGVSLMNLLNRRNQGSVTHTVDGSFDPNDPPPVITSRTRLLLGFTPNLSLRFKF